MELNIDAVLPNTSNKALYFFSGAYYVRYRQGKGIAAGYPRKTEWRGMWNIFPGPYDAAVIKHNASKYYFFKGSQYVRYTPGIGVDPGYPLHISSGWGAGALWAKMPGPYDAAFYAKTNNAYYFFKGDQYTRVNAGVGSGAVTPQYPLKISDQWNNLWQRFPGPYDAVVQSHTNADIYYFFKGNEYVRYRRGVGIDKSPSQYSWHYPMPTDYLWSGLWTLKPATAFTRSVDSTTHTFSVRLQHIKQSVEISPAIAGISLIQTSSITNSNLPGVSKQYQLTGLPSTPQKIRLVTQDSLGATSEIATFDIRALPGSDSSEDVVLAMGSCLNDAQYVRPRIPSIDHLLSEMPQPDLAIWNGDTSYYISDSTGIPSTDSTTKESKVVKDGDMRSQLLMFLRTFKTRHQPSISAAMKTIPAISVWDDHDFGFNNSESSNMEDAQIRDATEVFRTAWPNPYQHMGIEHKTPFHFRYGKVEIFCPDSRTNRNKSKATIFGDQLEPLLAALKATNHSSSALVILVLSSQLIPQGREKHENFYRRASQERTLLCSTLAGLKKRVLILSGDVHYSELSFFGDVNRPNLLEITSSPLLLKVEESPSTPPKESKPSRIWSSKYDNYAIISIKFTQPEPEIRIAIRNAESGDTTDIYQAGGGSGVNWPDASCVWKADGSVEH